MEATNNIRKVEGDKGEVRKLLVSQSHPRCGSLHHCTDLWVRLICLPTLSGGRCQKT